MEKIMLGDSGWWFGKTKSSVSGYALFDGNNNIRVLFEDTETALKFAATLAPKTAWKPIETAPRDKWIWAYNGYEKRWVYAKWFANPDIDGWAYWKGDLFNTITPIVLCDGDLTHWMGEDGAAPTEQEAGHE